MSNIVILSAHPDDLEMSCGGSVAKWVAEGHRVINLIMVPSVKHAKFLKNASQHLGHETLLYSSSSRKLEVDSELVAQVESYFADIKVDRIITHWEEDWHQDHQACNKLGRILARKQPVELWYMSSVPYNQKYSRFSPDIYVNIESYSHLKYRSIGEYYNLKNTSWPKMARSHDAWRGTFIEKTAAEVFKVESMFEL